MAADQKRTLSKAELQAMRIEGDSYATIAQAADISRQRVQQLIAPPKHVRDLIVKRFNSNCNNCGLNVHDSGHLHHPEDESNYTDTEGHVLRSTRT